MTFFKTAVQPAVPGAVESRKFLSLPKRFPFPLLFLLLAGAVVRIPLVLAGGRFFISDEGRYLHGVNLYYFLLRGDWTNAVAVLRHSDNWGFIIVSAGTTAVQHGMLVFTSHANWPVDLATLHQTLFLGAIVLAMAPVVAVWIVYHLALRLGADNREAFCAALILSLSNTAFYFSRHLFPYDASIAVALGATLIAAGPSGVMRSLLAGLLAGAAFHIYNAYWYLVPLVILTRLRSGENPRQSLAESGLTFAGATFAIICPYAWGWWMYGSSFAQSTMFYGRSVVQGLYREGWSLPWEYFWHSEGLFGLLVVGLPIALWLQQRSKQAVPERVRFLFAAVVGVYLVWITVSTVAHLFVLNARTVKPLVPLLCLLSGWALAALTRLNARLGWAVGVLLVALGAINLLPHYWRVFPREFEIAARNRVGNPKYTASVSGSYFDPNIPPVNAPDYVLVNAQYLYPIRAAAIAPNGETKLSAAHPLEYAPYQYDGFTPRQRGILRSTDIRMRLVLLADSASVPDLPRAEFQCVDGDWPDGFDSEAGMAKKSTPTMPK